MLLAPSGIFNGGRARHPARGWKRIALILALAGLGLHGAVATEATSTPRSENGHWAFRPPVATSPPRTPGSGDAGNPIDAFLDARLRELHARPASEATKRDLIRRVTFDLTGLPPTPADVRQFLDDSAPDAYERLVDRLLASPRFGERWAQHWLDLAHYADSNGFELDADRPDAWRYRDWVVRALNEDMPYDRFVTLQVAGDEVQPGSLDGLIAAGFARSGPREVVGGNIDPEVRRQGELTSATSTVGSVLLGLTIGCARCHDHKFDPIPSADYYRLQAFFAGAQLNDIPIHSAAEKERHEAETARIQALIKPIESAKAKLEEPYKAILLAAKEASLSAEERAIRAKPKEKRTPEEERLFEGTRVALKVTWEEIAETVATNAADHQAREALKRRIHELQLQLPPPLPHAMSMVEDSQKIPETRILKRGDIKNKQGAVTPAPPAILLTAMNGTARFSPPEAPIDSSHSGRRLALARWLVATNNPLTARVIVNRLWQHHFGRGLVETSSDFGARGAPPSNQALLDWLATELIRQGWRLKPIHRLMLTSRAYRRSSAESGPDAAAPPAADPANRHLWRMNRRRMDAEGLRDAILSVSGLLKTSMGGPGVHVPLEPEVRELIFTEAEVVDLWPVERDMFEHGRRSIYVHRKRNVHYPMFDAFDAPDAQTPCPQRSVSTHAPQALVLLNSQFAQKAATVFASRIARWPDPDDGITEAFLHCYARKPSPDELAFSRQFLGFDSSGKDQPDSAALADRWADFALALINSNEFLYVP